MQSVFDLDLRAVGEVCSTGCNGSKATNPCREHNDRSKTMKNSPNLTRRHFLKRTAGAAGAVAGTQILGMPALLSAASPNSTLGVAVIGAGGMGDYSFKQGMRERLVAFADVDDNTIAKKLKEFGEKLRISPRPRPTSITGSSWRNAIRTSTWC
jgi:hypothetical protein